MGFLTGKRILVTGLASNRSIAYGIAKAMKEQGAELAFTYLNDKLQPRVEEFAKEFGSDIVLPLDVATDESIQNCFAELSKRWEKFDGFVHAIAFAPGDQLDGDYVNAATREGYRIAHDISAFSFVAMAQAARPYLNPNAALLTLSYLGIRVNAISAGPIRTLAASGIKNLKKMLSAFEKTAALRRTVTIEDVGNSAAFLCSDLASGITGEIVHVDAGFSITAMGELGEE